MATLCFFDRLRMPDLLVLDDCGFDTGLGREAANEFFRLVCTRHRVRSMVVVTNLPFKQWDEFLPSPAQAVALVDRLVDQATILRFTGKPWRTPEDKEYKGVEEGGRERIVWVGVFRFESSPRPSSFAPAGATEDKPVAGKNSRRI